MKHTPPPPTDWEVLDVVHVVDGDTVDLKVRRPVGVLDPFTIEATGLIRVRLVHLDTPERSEPGHDEAADELGTWLFDRVKFYEPGTHLRVSTQGKDAFGRYLGDIYAAADRAQTASDYMVRQANNGNGWPVWAGS